MEIGHMCSLLMVIYPLYSDIREQRINILPAMILTVGGIFLEVFGGRFDMKVCLMGMLPGMCMYFMGKLFGNCIGAGDGVLITGIGALEGSSFCIRLLAFAGICILAFSVGMLAFGKLHLKSKVACVPFLAMGYLGAWLV